MQVEEQKRRAEADKLAAITALEARSREFMREKEEKRRLEARIATMQSQLLIGGAKLEESPVFRRAALEGPLEIARRVAHAPLPRRWNARLLTDTPLPPLLDRVHLLHLMMQTDP